jgi:hypothetical protein
MPVNREEYPEDLGCLFDPEVEVEVIVIAETKSQMSDFHNTTMVENGTASALHDLVPA